MMMVAATASGCGTASLAAHQIMNSILSIFTPIGESLSQTVQSLLPAANADSPDPRYLSDQGRRLVTALLKAALVLGAVDALVAGTLPTLASGLFTSSAAVTAQLGSISSFAVCILFFHALSTTLEGVLFTTGDGDFLGKFFYPLNALVTCSVLLKLRALHAPLPVIWATFLSYQVLRVSQFAARLVWNQKFRRTFGDKARGSTVRFSALNHTVSVSTA